jgi:transposase
MVADLPVVANRRYDLLSAAHQRSIAVAAARVSPRCAVFDHDAQWLEDGTWEHVTQAVRESDRRTMGRAAELTAAIIDSQSVKITEMGGPRGSDGAKKVKGRKRHLLVDTRGNRLKNKVQPADLHDWARAALLLEGLQHLFPAIERIWG